ncbi:AAA family ATPase [Candidatus Saganbacteria bacterium]|nr:AAA family ATPase [Candidatus Saganbacteria bacterium]
MFLKKISIKGFKTFADKTDIEFETPAGIAAIVGPNGCGKSNIVDSFRFALGESNVRDLRVPTLPEVIFAGTQTRKPLSLAEVYLVFDNAAGRLPVGYNEVMVKRRTFRDGTSEFSINNQACRLKDIRDLFLDTGLSSEALSIIGQGRVDALLSSKPEERRAVFEEVAGINKYKFRKLEAERKLIIAEQNLLRLSDIRSEMTVQLSALEEQARRAREYKELMERVHVLETGIYKKQILSMQEKKDKHQARIGELQSATAEVQEAESKTRDETARLEREIEETRRRLDEIREKVRDLAEAGRFLDFEIKNLVGSLSALKEKRQALAARLKKYAFREKTDLGDFSEMARLLGRLGELKTSLLAAFNKHEGRRNTDADRMGGELTELLNEEDQRLKEEELALKDALYAKQKQKTESSEIHKYEEAQNGLAKLLEKLKSDREKLLNREGEPAARREDREALIKEELQLAKLEGELEQLIDRILSEYSLDLDGILKVENEVSNVLQGRREVEGFKGRMRELEPVNLMAIEEYETARERGSFVEVQYQDIASTHENLKTLVRELDEKAREDFIKSLATVTVNFKEVFAGLFEGGEAKIELESGGDPLQAGIEISVCPSGRKWLPISLLSGGEKSLTAIAVLFAFLKTSPSPLSILDEVDAALDDANVERFTRYLRKFCENTQILVITHNKRTIAAADEIYGVTMEEAGVSKLVSIKLEPAAKT